MSPLVRLDQLQQFAAVNVLLDPGAVGGPVIIPNCAQIVLNWTLDGGKTAHNVLYGRAAGVPAPTPAQAEAIRSALTSGANWTAMASALAATTALASVTIRSVHTADQPIVQSTGAATPGTGGAVLALPNEMAICVTLRTALTGPANRGRMYLPGWIQTAVTAGNVIGAGIVSTVPPWAQGFISIFAAQGYTLVIGQRQRQQYTGSTGTLHPARAASSVAVTALVLRDNHWDSQRRRGLR